ncbi:LysE family translocator [Sphingobium sp. H39-3-25]|uniref:LysE family translocator n=1 Tax=Sphingobium arseniciresistens TaxID=3030834 RepID=UPI0023B8F3D8|nr:LysE family translocator [Sphingobium arseniciresistens]
MQLSTWWLYATAVFLVSGTPGPNMLHVMTRSIQVGASRSTLAMAGCLSAVLLCLLASAGGLGALLKAEPRLFDVLRYGGVAYLMWLGIKAWRAPVSAPGEAGAPRPVQSAASLYRGGLLIGLSNPKLIIFAAALFPQFIDAKAPFAPQLAILVATFAVIECGWYCVYALGGRSLARWLEPANRQRLFNRATGALFVGFGGALLGSRV